MLKTDGSEDLEEVVVVKIWCHLNGGWQKVVGGKVTGLLASCGFGASGRTTYFSPHHEVIQGPGMGKKLVGAQTAPGSGWRGKGSWQ